MVRGVIDVGSSSVRALVVRVDGDRWQTLLDARETTRLGALEHGALTDHARDRSREAIVRLVDAARELGCEPEVVATEAVRVASNGEEFVREVRAAGVPMRVLDAREEALAAFDAASREVGAHESSRAVIDVGGASVQVVRALGGVALDSVSMPIGAVRLTHEVGGGGDTPDVRAMRGACDRALERSLPRLRGFPDLEAGSVCCAGGSATSLASLLASEAGRPIDRRNPEHLAVLGAMPRRVLKAWIERLASMDASGRRALAGVPSERSDILLGGLVALHRTLKALRAPSVRAIAGGVREGLLLRSLASVRPLVAHAQELLSACEARMPADVGAHSRTVARLALRLEDALVDAGVLSDGDDRAARRELLCAGALTHDVGTMLGFPRHHHAGAGIVMNVAWAGVEASQRAMVSLLVRHHRRRGPSESDTADSMLPPEARERTLACIGMLRIADGLDRTHAGVVTGIHAARDGDGLTIHARIAPGVSASEELAAANDKSNVLAGLLAMPVRVVADHSPAVGLG